MIKKLGRLVFRENGDINKPDLILGVCFLDQNIFKANEVWQIEEILGELVLKKLGKSILNSGEIPYTWGRSVNDLLNMGKSIFLTKEEFDRTLNKEEE